MPAALRGDMLSDVYSNLRYYYIGKNFFSSSWTSFGTFCYSVALMDKRSFLFVGCCTAAFMAIQFFFGPKPEKASIKQPEQRIVALHDSAPPLEALVQRPSSPLPPSDTGESFYVLENEYQQLVFSTKGGALAEINLPLAQKGSKSLVKEIDVDRQIIAQSPQNARFPLHPYFISENGQNVLKQQGMEGGYYPLLRRSIFSKTGETISRVNPHYYALNLLGDGAADASMRVTAFGPRMIRFEGSTSHGRVTKTYTIPEERAGPYCFELEIAVDGSPKGLWLTSGVPDAELVGGSYAPQLKYQLVRPGGAEVDEISLPKQDFEENRSIHPEWVSNCNGFLGLILDPVHQTAPGYRVEKVPGNELPTRLSLIDPAYHLYPTANYPGYATLIPLAENSMKFRIFAGPYDEQLLKMLDDIYENLETGYNPEYNLAISIQGWFSFISQPFAKFLFLLMRLFYAVTQSWAAAIILLTIALKAMMYPLNNWSIRSTLKMQELAPKMQALQDKYKNDSNRGRVEMMNLYREAKANPLSGCLPMFLQMPFLIGMFYMLKSSFPLRGATFIPGWIDDLAAPDSLFSWGQPIPFIGNEFHLLPILTGLVMFVQGKMAQKPPKNPNQLSDTEKQQKLMGTMMSVLFTVMFYNFPSGLNIYFMFSTLLGILQQKFMMKKTQPVILNR